MAERNIDHVWTMMEKIGFCMLTTNNGEFLRSRPMSAYPRRHEDAIYFLADARHHKDEEIAEHPNVCLAFADSKGQKYVSVGGRAVVSRDRARIRDVWSAEHKAWWDSADDPNIRLLTVTPFDAEYWDSPGTVVSYIKMGVAAMTGKRPDIGENRKVVM
jgi:general stress protein 26